MVYLFKKCVLFVTWLLLFAGAVAGAVTLAGIVLLACRGAESSILQFVSFPLALGTAVATGISFTLGRTFLIKKLEDDLFHSDHVADDQDHSE